MKPHDSTLLTKTAKRVAPVLSRWLMREPMTRGLRMIEWYLAAIQGKGSGGGWDLGSEVKVAASVLPDGEAVVFDVGANWGHWSRELLAIRGNHPTRLFQFEPSELCADSLRAEKHERTTVISAAVGEQAGTVSFYVPEPGSTISSVHRQRDTYFQHFQYSEEKVPMVTVDQVVEEHHIARIDFMKMDVEGNELAVLKGAQKSLENSKIKALCFEFGSPQINSRCYFHDFWDVLHPAGFELFRICPGAVLTPVSEYYEDLEYFRGATNYLAVQPGLMRSPKY